MIKDLITDLAYDSITLSQALTRAKLIAAKVKDQTFRSWLESEVTGYTSDDLPHYRIVPATPYLKAQDRFGNQQTLRVQRLEILEDVFEEYLSKVKVHQSTTSLEGELSANKGQSTSGKHRVPDELAQIIGEAVQLGKQGFWLMEVWLEVPSLYFKNIVNLTKQKLLDTLMELNEQFPNLENDFQPTPENAAKVSTIINNHIYGNQNAVNTAAGQDFTQSNQITINAQHNEMLKEAEQLREFGVSEEDLSVLKQLILEEAAPGKKDSWKSKAMTWVAGVSGKSIEKGIELKLPQIIASLHKLAEHIT
ncbi:MAG: hypothetical protein H7330_05355 [Hymenobacteraceae bacterium]|nr:hypothetical protein [Hymenobacteraceae bacterium]